MRAVSSEDINDCPSLLLDEKEEMRRASAAKEGEHSRSYNT